MPGGKSRKSGGISKELVQRIANQAKMKSSSGKTLKKGTSCGSPRRKAQGPDLFGNDAEAGDNA